MRTKNSPTPNLTPLKESSARPIVATKTANHSTKVMFFRRITAATTGVNTTYKPVMKPVFETVVRVSPKD
jgi:hypothetical protein